MYEQIASNKRRSFLLIAFFVVMIFLLAWVFEQLTGMGEGGLIFAAVIAGVSAFAGYYASDKIALAISHARPVTKEEFPYLYNVVEGLTIAAGLPAPRCYVIDDTAPNAFATGRNPEHSVICVTTGLLAEAQPGRARGRRRPRDGPHQELRHPAPDAGRRDGRGRSPCWAIGSCGRSGGAGGAGRSAATGPASGPSFLSSAWSWPPSGRSSPSCSGWPSPGGGNSWPTPRERC